ncbi:MAG TPA: hypothetical protein DCE48_09265 [Lachnospiraceae bacterium]|uniref:hypothetical protein n=1 Tax=Anaerosporobacter sp. TaxID=1872529 RepID=UPI000EEB9391|nr:hypothetical protein [Anaerosporobacter sp.]HAB60877.1 hypothetical protein [Lachnospiraceae bacterium]
MFDQRHFNYTFTFTATSAKNTGIYTFNGSSDDMKDHFDKAEQLFFEEFNEYPTEVKRDSAIRIN